MNKLPWAKYYFSILAEAMVSGLIAKLVTDNLFILTTIFIGLYWFTVSRLARIKGY